METHIQAPSEEEGPSSKMEFNEVVLGTLKGTEPWIKLVSAAGFLMSAVCLTEALLFLFGVIDGDGVDGVERGTSSLASFFMALIYVIPSVLLFQYASAIHRVVQGVGSNRIEEAMRHQMAFWRVAGIIILATAASSILGILFF